jgi:hypothetical protein
MRGREKKGGKTSPTSSVRFGSNERRRANDEQIQSFFVGYEATWRVTKLLAIRRLLRDREGLKAELRAHYGDALPDYDQYVYGATTNGLLFSAVAELMMHVEDFFALLQFVREREFFARELVTYKAGSVTNTAKVIESASDDRILSAFMVPPAAELPLAEEADMKAYRAGAKAIVYGTRNAAATYGRYEFFYRQYKHGLTVALHPYGAVTMPESRIEKLKTTLSGTLACYDNESIANAMKEGRIHGVVTMTLLHNTTPFLAELQAERNLLRLQPFERGEVSIDTLIEAGIDIAALIMSLVDNRVYLANPAIPGANSLRLPSVEPSAPLRNSRVDVTRAEGPWAIDRFPTKL